MKRWLFQIVVMLMPIALACSPAPASAYSLLTHEQLIDLTGHSAAREGTLDALGIGTDQLDV